MSNSYRAAVGDLSAEDGNDTAVAAEHIAKADGREAGAIVPGSLVNQQFGDALGGAHDTGGVHGLVGGDQD